MTDYREQAIRDVAEAMGVTEDDVVFYMRPHTSSSKLAYYAVAQRERALRLEARLQQKEGERG